MKKDIEYFRQKIRAMEYTPLTDEELAVVIEKHIDAVEDVRLEGYYLTADDDEFFAMLNEERVPLDIQADIVYEWVISNL
ncbi:hypothetical protein [Psychrobacter sp. I-STPA6b]|uniref:hypothetical protein n=1 Tax=Psychrobacter sp. I-STPA6b TaxID=2585718 RepID=UPI001D0C6C1C|nr:hypothetical protein [Psychrobacter sp. I-STPA6b]